MRIEHDLKLNFDDVLIRPKRSVLVSRKDVVLGRSYNFLHSKLVFMGIPIIASNMNTVGTIDAALVMQQHQMLTWVHKFEKLDNVAKLNTRFSMPTIGELDRSIELGKFHCVRLDVANGYRESFVEFVKYIRGQNPHITIFAGNVCTPEMTEELILAGADVVVVGIGSGGACITRTKTGIGYPQLSAIIECADAAHGIKGHIVADGGCRTPADVVKAFAAGADFVSLGTMLAAHNENSNPQEFKLVNGTTYCPVYGMSSKDAMEKFYGGIDDHRAAEGVTNYIKYRGALSETLKDILGSLRSACSYVGAESLKELSKRTTFIRTNEIRNNHWENQHEIL